MVTYSYFIEQHAHLRVLQCVSLEKNEKPITKIKKEKTIIRITV
jgi:hypothetical protein